MKKKLVMLILITIVMGGANGLTAFADDNTPKSVTQSVEVSYSPSIVVGDGDYCVILPKAISFKEKDREVDASVHLANKNGSTYSGDDIVVGGTVTSTNKFKLKCKDGKDGIPYKLKYGNKDMSDDNISIGTFTKNNKDLLGKAILPQSSEPSINGAHRDTLTYTFTKDGTKKKLNREIKFLGYQDRNYASLYVDFNTNKIKIDTYEGTPHAYIHLAGRIEILNEKGNVVCTKKFLGTTWYNNSTEEIEMKPGYEIKLKSEEPWRVKIHDSEGYLDLEKYRISQDHPNEVFKVTEDGLKFKK